MTHPTQPEWLPIDSAPRDGSDILTFDAVLGQYEISGYWVNPPRYWDGRHWGDGEYYHQPTHWLPLPPPPKESE